MKKLLAVYLLIISSACIHRTQSNNHDPLKDTILPVLDTAMNPYAETDRVADSLERKHLLDSLYAIKPIAIFRSDKNGDAYSKMIASLIDTSGIIKMPIAFSDTAIYTYDKDQNPISGTDIWRSRRFVVKVFIPDLTEYSPRKLYINGREMRAGIEIDTSLSGTFYVDNIQIRGDECWLMKFGSREYLLLSGYIEKCTGMACSVSYYMLFDLVTQKAMLLQQFRSEFTVGFDKIMNMPIFIDMGSDDSHSDLFQCFFYSGELYRFGHSGKISRVAGPMTKQHHFEAFARDSDIDTIFLLERNLPVRN